MKFNQKNTGTPKNYEPDRGGGVIRQYPVLGIVKDNIDRTHSGTIRVYIAEFSGVDPENSDNWIPVKYLSPWFGVISPGYDPKNGTERTGYGQYVGNPQSYGFWATAPDIGTTVVCVFINGQPDDGYYIGCVPTPGLHHMVPAIGASKKAVPTEGEAEYYGGADSLPATEINWSNAALRNSSAPYSEPKPVHSYVAAAMHAQGILRDSIRGPISSSSQRETPSRVFGMSTPGQAIYEGGYTGAEIIRAASDSNVDISKLQAIGRTGGHSIVLDDGTLAGTDVLMRLRTTAGHQILLSDSGQCINILHANGRSWIELGAEGTIDVYGTNSINLRTEGDLNLHADRDVNIHAKRNLTMYGENVKIEAKKDVTALSAGKMNFESKTIWSVKAAASLSLEGATAYLGASAATFIKGKPIFLNTGQGVPALPVKALTMTQHVDTAWESGKGWVQPAPEPLLSVTSRAPAHWPWKAAGAGVDVSSGKSGGGGGGPLGATLGSALPSQSGLTAAISSARNAAAGTIPLTNNSLLATLPITSSGSSRNILSMPTLTSLVSQQAVVGDTIGSKVLGYVGGGATLSTLSGPGNPLKPGSGQFMTSAQAASGFSVSQLVNKNILTGVGGITEGRQLAGASSVQVDSVRRGFTSAATSLQNAGVIDPITASSPAGAGLIYTAYNNGVSSAVSALRTPSTASAYWSNNNTQPITAGSPDAPPPGSSQNPVSITNTQQRIGVQQSTSLTGPAASFLSGMVASTVASTSSSANIGISSSLRSLVTGAGGGGLGAAASRLGNTIGNSAIRAIGNGVGGILSGAGSSLSSGLGKLLGGGGSGIRNLLGGATSLAQSAFATAVASFGSLKARQPNYLGGSSADVESPGPGAISTANRLNLQDDILEADAAYLRAEREYQRNPTSESLDALREAEAQRSAITSRSNTATSPTNVAYGLISKAENGMIGWPTSLNTGINAIPGGIGAYYGLIPNATKQVQNVVGTFGSLTSASSIGSLGERLNFNNIPSLGNVGSSITSSLSSLSPLNTNLSSLTGGIGTNLSSLTGSFSGGFSGLAGGFSGLGGSIGGMFGGGGGVKAATLATNTFAPTASIISSASTAIGDPRVPVPGSPVNPDAAKQSLSVIEGLQRDQSRLNKQLDELRAELESVNQQILVIESSPERYSELQQLTTERSRLQSQIFTTTQQLDRVVSGRG